MQRRISRGQNRWQLLVPVVCLVAGVGFAASARDSDGTDLRPPSITTLADTVRRAEDRVQGIDAQVGALQAEVNRRTAEVGGSDSAVAKLQREGAPLRVPGGLRAVTGPGLEVSLDDAADTSGDDTGAAGADGANGTTSDDALVANQKVVHQSDLQAVVNALWAGGAEAMSVAGQRVIATSAVRCVGNTLLLNGEVYSPPFRVAAIGPAGTMLDRLDESPGVAQFREAANYFGLGYTTSTTDSVRIPAYRGPVALTYAKPGAK